MRKMLLTKVSLSTLSFLSISAFAQNDKTQNFTITGSHSVTIPINSNLLDANDFSNEKLSGLQTIKLMSVIPSQKFIEQNKLANEEMEANGGELDYSKGIKEFQNSASSIDLKMANVPVLNQGQFGTCVTFSSTAAVDALLNQGDFIDQECNLALNKSLGNDYWDGAYYPSQIIDPIIKYGIVSKNHCFGVRYPDNTFEVTPALYQTKSNKSFNKLISYTLTENNDIESVKKSLRKGNRVLTGFGLAVSDDPISVNGFDITIKGKPQNYSGGLWACKQSSSSTNYCSSPNAGHEVLIIGYDDKQKLLKIRNSWGKGAGESGNYYMTYEYFKAMSADHTSVQKSK